MCVCLGAERLTSVLVLALSYTGLTTNPPILYEQNS